MANNLTTMYGAVVSESDERVEMFMQVGSDPQARINVTPADARRFAVQLLQLAEVAEGKVPVHV